MTHGTLVMLINSILMKKLLQNTLVIAREITFLFYGQAEPRYYESVLERF